VSEAGQCGDRGGNAGCLARAEWFPEENKSEQRSDHETHLRNRHGDARLGTCDALDHAGKTECEHESRPRSVAERRGGWPNAAIQCAGKRRGECDDRGRLRNDQRTRRRTGTHSEGANTHDCTMRK
jgi:hypothetical protein